MQQVEHLGAEREAALVLLDSKLSISCVWLRVSRFAHMFKTFASRSKYIPCFVCVGGCVRETEKRDRQVCNPFRNITYSVDLIKSFLTHKLFSLTADMIIPVSKKSLWKQNFNTFFIIVIIIWLTRFPVPRDKQKRFGKMKIDYFLNE